MNENKNCHRLYFWLVESVNRKRGPNSEMERHASQLLVKTSKPSAKGLVLLFSMVACHRYSGSTRPMVSKVDNFEISESGQTSGSAEVAGSVQYAMVSFSRLTHY